MQGLHTSAWASPGTEVFQGFTQHIGAQIGKDKLEFSIADTCTAWFYKRMGKKPRPEVEKIHFVPLVQNGTDLDCAEAVSRGVGAGQAGLRAYAAATLPQPHLFSNGFGGGWR